jgi:cytochrome c oxidase cbb3-type subunit 2
VIYIAGVSIYSTALVYFPARSGRRWVAAGLFAAAGWVGSAIGVSLAENLHRIPPWAVGIAAFIAIGALIGRHWTRRSGGSSTHPPVTTTAAVLVLCFFLPSRSEGAPLSTDVNVTQGREVYIGEGCMYCHSQYIRPATADVVMWGPEASLADRLKETPPLFSNRRQGPDLTNVGNRRTPEWNRLHLENPRQISPGSRMPSYAHLFAPGDLRGPALLAYLASLGGATWEKRVEAIQAWRPAPSALAGSPSEQSHLYGQLCAQCHGANGAGDGPLASRLNPRPANLHQAWARVNPADEVGSLARTIKFGALGTAMAGHEYLSDQEVLSLVAYVQRLHKVPSGQ